MDIWAHERYNAMIDEAARIRAESINIANAVHSMAVRDAEDVYLTRVSSAAMEYKE